MLDLTHLSWMNTVYAHAGARTFRLVVDRSVGPSVRIDLASSTGAYLYSAPPRIVVMFALAIADGEERRTLVRPRARRALLCRRSP